MCKEEGSTSVERDDGVESVDRVEEGRREGVKGVSVEGVEMGRREDVEMGRREGVKGRMECVEGRREERGCGDE